MRALLLTLALTVLTLPGRARADSLRCGNQLVTEGATSFEAESKCGAPTSRNVRTQVLDQSSRWTRTNDGRTRAHHTQAVTLTVEEWLYDFGPNRLIQIVVFENGRIVEVKSAGYGS